MRVLVDRQCDAIGPDPRRRQALFPGQIYDLDEHSVKALVEVGAVRVLEERGRSEVTMTPVSRIPRVRSVR